MSTTMIQIRNVPSTIHKKLKVRAATEGISMSEFVLREVKRALARPNRQEVLDRIERLPPIELAQSPADIIRQERDHR